MKSAKKFYNRLSAALVTSDEDYSIARTVEPLISNKALISFLIPILLITALQLLQPFLSENDDLQPIGLIIIGWSIALWYVFTFLITAGLVARWFFSHRSAVAKNHALTEVTKRLASALVRSHRNDPTYFEIVRWEEVIQLRRNGDARIDRTVTVRAGSRPVAILWSACISYTAGQSFRNVKIRAFRKTQRGESQITFDPTWDSTQDGLRSDVHIYPMSDLPANSEMTFRIRWKWPRYAESTLAIGKEEQFDYNFNRPCATFRVEIKAPKHTQMDAEFRLADGQLVPINFDGAALTLGVEDLRAGDQLVGNLRLLK